MHPTRIDLPADAREALAALLNASLADAIDLQSHAKQAHWNVKGPNFIAIHELFDTLAAHAATWADDLAERAITLGGAAEGTLAVAGRRSRLPNYALTTGTARAHIDGLAQSFAAFSNALRAAIDESARLGDAVTSDLFTGMAGEAEKDLWFLEAHLQGE